jgi:DNA-directed RNA polymerase specialized sigma24 family protein
MGQDGRSERREGDFDALFDAHYAELRRYAVRRVENRAAIDDILAETFATAWRRRDQMPGSALPWLLGICHKVMPITAARRGGACACSVVSVRPGSTSDATRPRSGS